MPLSIPFEIFSPLKIKISVVMVYMHGLDADLVFVDADVRLARRIRRDTLERGRDINSVLEQVSYYSSY